MTTELPADSASSRRSFLKIATSMQSGRCSRWFRAFRLLPT